MALSVRNVEALPIDATKEIVRYYDKLFPIPKQLAIHIVDRVSVAAALGYDPPFITLPGSDTGAELGAQYYFFVYFRYPNGDRQLTKYFVDTKKDLHEPVYTTPMNDR
jgi:hypothetical protein